MRVNPRAEKTKHETRGTVRSLHFPFPSPSPGEPSQSNRILNRCALSRICTHVVMGADNTNMHFVPAQTTNDKMRRMLPKYTIGLQWHSKGIKKGRSYARMLVTSQTMLHAYHAYNPFPVPTFRLFLIQQGFRWLLMLCETWRAKTCSNASPKHVLLGTCMCPQHDEIRLDRVRHGTSCSRCACTSQPSMNIYISAILNKIQP